MNNVYFLTNNTTKAEHFKSFGLSVKPFNEEIKEILSNNVEQVALYKSLDANINNSVVEDTALYLKGHNFYGTQIKYAYDYLSTAIEFHDHEAFWEVCLAYKHDDVIDLFKARLNGVLKYPACNKGYHFENIFCVQYNGEYINFHNLPIQLQNNFSPREHALKLFYNNVFNKENNKEKIETNKLISTKIKTIKIKDILEWKGAYQDDLKHLTSQEHFLLNKESLEFILNNEINKINKNTKFSKFKIK